MSHLRTQAILEEAKKAEFDNEFLDIVNPLFRSSIVSQDIEWDLLMKARNKFYRDQVPIEQAKDIMNYLKLASQTKHLQTAKVLLNKYIDGRVNLDFLTEKLTTFASKQKFEEKDTNKDVLAWTALVEKEMKQHQQCAAYFNDDLKLVNAFYIKLQQYWINSIPSNSSNVARDFEKTKASFNKLFNIINQVVRLFVMARGDDLLTKDFDNMIHAFGPLVPYLGEKANSDSATITKMLKSANIICEKIIAKLNKSSVDIKEKMTDAAAPRSSQKEMYKKAVLYIEQWIAIQFSQIKPSFMQKNTLQQMQEYISLRKASDQDWENIYHNLRAKFVVPKLLKEFTTNQSLPTPQQVVKQSSEVKLPTFEEPKKTSQEREQARHLFYVEVGEAFKTDRIAELPDRLLLLLSTFNAMRVSAAVAAEMKEIPTSHVTLKNG